MLISFRSIERLTGTNRQDRIALEPNAIHLWAIELDGSSHCLKLCAEWLDEVERHRAARLIREEDRRYYVLAHGGLRAVLSRYLGVNPDVVALVRGETGKPSLIGELRDRSAITFNLSHAHGRALIGVSKAQEIGVDLEFVRADIEVTDLSKRFFTRSEHTAIMQAAEEQRAPRFFRYWVAKEALLKAHGIGLGGLPHCEIFLEEDRLNTDIRTRLGAQVPNTLRVRLLSCEKGWEAAVAAQLVDCIRQCGLEQQ